MNIVLGAGPAGVGAAWRLATRGHDVTVLERAPAVGGLAGSFEVGGLRVDHGSHRLHPSTAPEILRVLTELLGTDLQLRTRNGRIRIAERFVRFPPRAADLARQLPPRLTARLVRDAITAPLRRPRADTFAEAVRASLGPTMADSFYAPFVEKIWGLPATQLSGELARKRVGARSARGLVQRALRSDARRGFMYPKRGFGEITEALAGAATAAGATIRLGAEVTRVESRADGVVVETADGARVEATYVLSTLPAAALVRLSDPAPPPAVADAASGLRSRGIALVYLVLAQARFTEFDAHYFPEPDIAVSRISEPKNYRDSAADPQAVTVLCGELPVSAGDDRWRASDADLASVVVDDLARAGLGTVRPVDHVVRRVAHVYPRYDLEYATRLATVESWLATHPRIVSVGRHARFAYDNSHHGIEMGWAAADAIGADGHFDRAAWNAAVARSRAHIVED